MQSSAKGRAQGLQGPTLAAATCRALLKNSRHGLLSVAPPLLECSSSALKEPAACLKRQLCDRGPLASSLPCPARIIQDSSFWPSCNQLSFPAAVRKSLKALALDKLTMPWTRQPQEPILRWQREDEDGSSTQHQVLHSGHHLHQNSCENPESEPIGS